MYSSNSFLFFKVSEFRWGVQIIIRWCVWGGDWVTFTGLVAKNHYLVYRYQPIAASIAPNIQHPQNSSCDGQLASIGFLKYDQYYRFYHISKVESTIIDSYLLYYSAVYFKVPS